MTDLDDYKKLYEEERKKVEVLEARLRNFELPGDMRGYYALQRMLNLQSDFLNSFDFLKEVKAPVVKDDKLYDRASDLWEKMPVSISRLNSLKTELSITGNQQKDTAKKPFNDMLADVRS